MAKTRRFLPGKFKEAKAGKTCEEIGRACGLTRWTVKRWEKGLGEPTATQLFDMAEFLGRPAEFFIRRRRAV